MDVSSDGRFLYILRGAPSRVFQYTLPGSFTLTGRRPSFGSTNPLTHQYIAGATVNITLPAASGGNGALSYDLILRAGPGLVALGLVFDSAARTLSGTVNFEGGVSRFTESMFTYRVQDADPDETETDRQDRTLLIRVDEQDTIPRFTQGQQIEDMTYLVGDSVNVTLPAEADSEDIRSVNRPVTYRIPPSTPLPNGLNFNESTRVLSGIPITPGTFNLLYRARDRDADFSLASDDLSFTITTVEQDTQPTFGAATIADQTYIPNFAISLTLPAATRGNPTLLYSITPVLPDGLTFDAATRVLSGTPTNVTVGLSYDYIVQDSDTNTADSDLDSLSFLITIELNRRPTFESTDDLVLRYAVGETVNTILPAATGGNGAFIYNLLHRAGPSLSEIGLTRATGTRPLSGTVANMTGESGFTHRVQDADPDRGGTDRQDLTVRIIVEPDFRPRFTQGQRIEDMTYVIGDSVNVTLPEADPQSASAGNRPYTYRIVNAAGDPATLPDGLNFDENTRVLSGSPTTPGTSDFRYQARDRDGDLNPDTETISFMIMVEADTQPTFGATTIANQSHIADSAITPLTLPEASDGNRTLSYSLVPTSGSGVLPAGLAFDAATQVLSGTPITAQPGTGYTYTATDADGDEATLTFTIEVEADTQPTFGVATIANQSHIADSAITPLTLPEASDGNRALTYRITPVLPDGLTFDADTRVLSGTPTVPQLDTGYTYTATDADGDEATLTFNIEVEADTQPTFGAATIANQSHIADSAITPLTLPEASDGNRALIYTLADGSGNLPDGLTFDADTRVLSGTPTTAQPGTSYTYTATDADGDEATLTFTIEVDADTQPTFGAATIANQSHIADSAITPLTLPEASDGNRALTYRITPVLPDGLTFDADTRVLSGTPTVPQLDTGYTYTATDADGDEATLTFNIEVEADTQPTFGAATIANQSHIADSAITPLTLPEASDGNRALIYTLADGSGNLPDGLTFDADTRVLSGTPTTAQPGTSYTYTATDADGDEATLTFTIEVEADTQPTFGAANIANQSHIADSAITPLTLPEASDGNGALIYTLADGSGGLSAGLTFDADTRVLSGTPTVPQLDTGYTYTATDADGDEATLTFTIEVEADTHPTFGAANIANQSHIADSAITPLTLPEASDGNRTLSYSLVPTSGSGVLPEGLTFDADTRVLSGTPTVPQLDTGYTYTATDADGDEATLTFNIEVDADTQPTFGAATIANQHYIADSAITSLTLPESSDGNRTLSYSLVPTSGSGVLPEGLTFDADTRVLSGTPTVPQLDTSYTYAATNADGDEATLMFNIIVFGPLTIRGTVAGSVTEDGPATEMMTSATLMIDNPAGGSEDFVPQTDTDGIYGLFSITAGGIWTYTLGGNAANDADLNALAAGDTPIEVFLAATAADSGITQTVRITVIGANDAPTVTIIAPAPNMRLTSAGAMPVIGTGTDVDIGARLRYAWSTQPANQGSFTDAGSVRTSWTATTVTRGSPPMTVTLRLTVTDSARPPVSTTAEVTVMVTSAAVLDLNSDGEIQVLDAQILYYIERSDLSQEDLMTLLDELRGALSTAQLIERAIAWRADPRSDVNGDGGESDEEDARILYYTARFETLLRASPALRRSLLGDDPAALESLNNAANLLSDG